MKLFRLIPTALCLLLMLGLLPAAFGDEKIMILFSDAVEGNLKPLIASEGSYKGQRVGGYAFVAGAINQLRTEADSERRSVIIVDVGNFLFGTPEAYFSRGVAAVDLMNAIGYDAAVIGNLDFNLRAPEIEQRSREARFPFLGANVLDRKTRQPARFLKPYVILPSGRQRIAILGLSRHDTPHITPSYVLQDLLFPHANDSAAVALRAGLDRWLPEIRKENVAAVVVVYNSHLPVEDSAALSEEDQAALEKTGDEVDLIIGRSTDTAFEQPVHIGRRATFVRLRAERGQEIGCVRLTIKEPNDVLFERFDTIPIFTDRLSPSKEIVTLVGNWEAKLDQVLDQPVGETLVALNPPAPDVSDATLARLVTKAMLTRVKADAAFLNARYLRESIPKGPITHRMLFQAIPFENWLVLLDMRGKDLCAALKRSAQKGPGKGLATAGISHDSAENGEDGWTIRGEPLDDNKQYTVVVNSFLADGGDGFVEFRSALSRKDVPYYVRDIVTRYVREHSPIRFE